MWGCTLFRRNLSALGDKAHLRVFPDQVAISGHTDCHKIMVWCVSQKKASLRFCRCSLDLLTSDSRCERLRPISQLIKNCRVLKQEPTAAADSAEQALQVLQTLPEDPSIHPAVTRYTVPPSDPRVKLRGAFGCKAINGMLHSLRMISRTFKITLSFD